MNKNSKFIKLISIILVFCSLFFIVFIPTSAVSPGDYVGNVANFFSYHIIEKFALQYIEDDYATAYYTKSSGHLNSLLTSVMSSPDQSYVIFSTKEFSTPLSLFSIQIPENISYSKGDKLSFNISLYSNFSDAMRFYIYFDDGSSEYFSLHRSLGCWSSENWIKNYSHEPLSFGGQQVYCYNYTLNLEYEFLENKKIVAYQFQQKFNSSGVSSAWFYFDNFTWMKTPSLSTSNSSIINFFSSFFHTVVNLFNHFKEFVLKFGTKIKDALSPLFNTLGGWISNAAENVKSGFVTVLHNIKDGVLSLPDKISHLGEVIISPIKAIGESISNYFQNTFLGKVLQVTSKSKQFVNTAGSSNGVTYSLRNDSGEDSEAAEDSNSDDWDMKPSPSFVIDFEYYDDLYPNLLVGEAS